MCYKALHAGGGVKNRAVLTIKTLWRFPQASLVGLEYFGAYCRVILGSFRPGLGYVGAGLPQISYHMDGSNTALVKNGSKKHCIIISSDKFAFNLNPQNLSLFFTLFLQRNYKFFK